MKRRLARLISTFCITCACGASIASEPRGTVAVQQGNIVYSDPSGATEVLTETGADGWPALSPDGSLLVFTRVTQDATNYDPAVRDLWVIHLQTHEAVRLVKGKAEGDGKPEDDLADIHRPRFSPDSKTIYFMTAGWATSGAIHAVPATGGAQRFLTHGNSVDVVSQGKYKGALLVTQHRYMDPVGSWNPAVLVTPSGKQIKVVGERRDALQSVEAER